MLTMKELLNKALDQLKIAKVTINPRSLRKQISLFETDDSQEVEFNGSKTPSGYHEQLYAFYLPCKLLVDQMMNESLHKAHEIKREFDMYCFEIREFRQRYFPKEYVDVLLYRVELHKSSSKELINSEGIKKNS